MLHKPDSAYLTLRRELNTQVKTVNILQTASMQAHIADLVNHEYNLDEIKHHLKLVYKLNTDFINSLSELASPFHLEEKQKKIE